MDSSDWGNTDLQRHNLVTGDNLTIGEVQNQLAGRCIHKDNFATVLFPICYEVDPSEDTTPIPLVNSPRITATNSARGRRQEAILPLLISPPARCADPPYSRKVPLQGTLAPFTICLN